MYRILIIEDEKNIQAFMGKVLKRHDYRVLCADNGKDGLELIRSQCPDIILWTWVSPTSAAMISSVRYAPGPVLLSS